MVQRRLKILEEAVKLLVESAAQDAMCTELLDLVDLVRFELTTSSMPWKRAPNCATGPLSAVPPNVSQAPPMQRVDRLLERLPTIN